MAAGFRFLDPGGWRVPLWGGSYAVKQLYHLHWWHLATRATELLPGCAVHSVAMIMDDDTGFSYIDSLRYTGLQYVVRIPRTP